MRDAVRDRDAAAINEAVLTIVADGVERMANLRKDNSSPLERELDTITEVVDWGIRTFASYVGKYIFSLKILSVNVLSTIQDGSISI